MPNKAHLIITAAALVILASVLGYVAYRQNPPVPNTSPSAPTAPSVSFQPPAPAVDTSNWKTYRNDKYGFEVKYPFSWNLDSNTIDKVNDAERGLVTGAANFALYPPSLNKNNSKGYIEKLEFFFVSASPNKTPEQLVREESSYVNIIRLGDNNWATGQMPKDSPGDGAPIFAFIKNGVAVKAAAYNLSGYSTIYNQILSTFHFLN